MSLVIGKTRLRSLLFAATATGLVVLCGLAYHSMRLAEVRKIQAEIVPSTIGTFWLYRGTSREQIADNKIDSKEIEDTETVVDCLRARGLTASLVEKHIVVRQLTNDLDSAKASSVCAPDTFDVRMVFDNSRFYDDYHRDDLTPLATWSAIKQEVSSGKVPAEPSESYLVMKLPCHIGSSWDNVASTPRNDGMYAYTVENIDTFKAGLRFASYTLPKDTVVYTTAFRTCPDTSVQRFMPGVGITAKSYVHHGTFAESDSPLVQFYKAQP